MAYAAVVFDLLTALLDSWSLWNEVAGSSEAGRRWRLAYLELTYGADRYVPYRDVVQQAARDVGLGEDRADALLNRWVELKPWPEAPAVLREVAARVPVGIATNCSVDLANLAVGRLGVPIAVVVTAEEVGWYKPSPQVYLEAARRLETDPGTSLFVAGSPGDVAGGSAVGFDVYWHDRVGLPEAAPPTFRFGSLTPLLELI